MQYWQRRLQRSVTERRRFRNGLFRRSSTSSIVWRSRSSALLQGVVQAFRPAVPTSRDNFAARRARAARRDLHLADDVSPARHQDLVALWTVGVFEIAYLSWQVTGINVAKPRSVGNR